MDHPKISKTRGQGELCFSRLFIYGKLHIVQQLYRKNGCKKPFLFALNTTTIGNGPKWNSAQNVAQTTLYLPGSHLSGLIQLIGWYTWQQTKGVQCGISKIANYNSSCIQEAKESLEKLLHY